MIDLGIMTARKWTSAHEYCRTNFDVPAYFPDIRTLEKLREVNFAVRLLTGEFDYKFNIHSTNYALQEASGNRLHVLQRHDFFLQEESTTFGLQPSTTM